MIILSVNLSLIQLIPGKVASSLLPFLASLGWLATPPFWLPLYFCPLTPYMEPLVQNTFFFKTHVGLPWYTLEIWTNIFKGSVKIEYSFKLANHIWCRKHLNKGNLSFFLPSSLLHVLFLLLQLSPWPLPPPHQSFFLSYCKGKNNVY